MSPSLDRSAIARNPREVKFVVPREVARHVRSWAWEWMQPDPYAVPALDHAYHVRSLYLDTPEMDVFHRRGSYARGKYRIREYLPSGIVFLERKLKSKGIVRKRRTITDLSELQRLQEEPEADWPGLWYHRRLIMRRLQPVCQISYLRYPFMLGDGSEVLRLTIDEQVQAGRVARYEFDPEAETAQLLAAESILELKYFMEMPALFKKLADQFGLSPKPISKYRLAVPALGIAQEIRTTEPALCTD